MGFEPDPLGKNTVTQPLAPPPLQNHDTGVKCCDRKCLHLLPLLMRLTHTNLETVTKPSKVSPGSHRCRHRRRRRRRRRCDRSPALNPDQAWTDFVSKRRKNFQVFSGLGASEKYRMTISQASEIFKFDHLATVRGNCYPPVFAFSCLTTSHLSPVTVATP